MLHVLLAVSGHSASQLAATQQKWENKAFLKLLKHPSNFIDTFKSYPFNRPWNTFKICVKHNQHFVETHAKFPGRTFAIHSCNFKHLWNILRTSLKRTKNTPTISWKQFWNFIETVLIHRWITKDILLAFLKFSWITLKTPPPLNHVLNTL